MALLLGFIATDERNMHGAIYELSSIDREFSGRSYIYPNLKMKAEEKKERMELLLDAGADVTAVSSISKATIFHYFCWYPFEEDYTGLLDRMTEKGADLFQKDSSGDSCIHYMLDAFALESNTEAYLEYVISRGLNVTREDLMLFLSRWSNHMASKEITDIKKERLEKITRIVEKNLKVTVLIGSNGDWDFIE